MKDWVDHVAGGFQAEFAKLWAVSDPDDVLFGDTVSRTLVERGIDVVEYAEPIAFRLLYERDLRENTEAAPTIIHVRGDARQELPWDVLQSSRHVDLRLAEIFDQFDPTILRAIGGARLPDLWRVAQRQVVPARMGSGATADFILASIFRITPALLDKSEDFWVTALALFYADVELPAILAGRVVELAELPEGMTDQDAFNMLTDRSALLDRLQVDWRQFAIALVNSDRPAGALVPFGAPRIRVMFDSLVLDGAIKPIDVPEIPKKLPSWAKIGLQHDMAAKADLICKQIDRLKQDIPQADANYRDWLRYGERLAELTYEVRNYPKEIHHETVVSALEDLRRQIDPVFFDWLGTNFDSLSLNSCSSHPSLVHQVAPHMAMARTDVDQRQALLVVDGLALEQWHQLEQDLRDRQLIGSIDARSCFAWIPTVTSVSRQSIFAGNPPKAFANSISGTNAEKSLWGRFWAANDIPDAKVVYMKGLGGEGSTSELEHLLDRYEPLVAGLVIDTVDELMHGEIFGKKSLTERIAHWLEMGQWANTIEILLTRGFDIYVTADHGNVEAVGVGRPAEGVRAESRGERMRIYDSPQLLNDGLAKIPGARVLAPRALPDNYHPLFADYGQGFFPAGHSQVVHGGTDIEEVIVPFVKITRKEKK
ncbi:BREX-3 system phosphatase PglZ [Pacificimonas flava]|uniref:Uncharacterized protein n=1 Tax=Pacificimonas flava TaxID=1234595 RepID=M2S980_9SPHN|nr:BREX-3 system phosphatase PglZ [Pacificimonas flava]EMD81930.1 hypothetical protein C725_2719 [Pacificimonas flava]MBB5281538.1 hypothetical protein [Pacificimonas flava]